VLCCAFWSWWFLSEAVFEDEPRAPLVLQKNWFTMWSKALYLFFLFSKVELYFKWPNSWSNGKKLLLSIALEHVLREWGHLILHALEGKWREHFDVSEGRQMLSTFWLYLARQSDPILCRSEPNQHLYSPFVESSQVSWVFLVVSSLRNLMWACLYYLLLCCCIWESDE